MIMPSETSKSLPISAEILGLSDVVVEDVKIDLSARKITIFQITYSTRVGNI